MSRGRRAGARQADRQLGLLWGAVAALLLALSPAAPSFAASLPGCPLKLWSGLPCAACGATRAAVALAGGDLAGALALSPLAAFGWSALVLGGLIAGLLALAGRPWAPPRGGLPAAGRAMLVGVVVANWLYLVWSGA